MTSRYATEPYPFTHAGRRYSLMPPASWPIDAVRRITRGEMDAFAQLVGEAEWEQLCSDGFTMGQLNDVLTDAMRQDPEEPV